MKKLSIIVPVFNAGIYLKDCLDSLINQSLDDIEIICIDDASTDNSLDILNSYAKNYPQIKIFQNNTNMGQGYTRNIGIKEANGLYIGFVDSDDYVNKTMYENLYNAAKDHDYPEVICTNITFVKDNSYLNKEIDFKVNTTCYNPLEQPERVLDESPSACNKIFLKSSINPFLEGVMWEDITFTYSLLFKAKKVINVLAPGYYYRKSSVTGVSARGFVVNPKLLDIFIVADSLEPKDNPYVKYLQSVIILQRMTEVLNWNIPENEKKQIIYKMHELILQKYTDWRCYDQALLSSRIGILELLQIKNIIDNYTYQNNENLSNILLKLKKY